MIRPPVRSTHPLEVTSCERLVAREIVLQSPDGKSSTVVTAFDDCVGVWVASHPDKPRISIWINDQGAGIGMYAPGDRPSCSIAMGTTSQGDSFLQIADGKDPSKYVTIDADKQSKLIALLKE